MTRALFINSGMAGHRTFAALMRRIVGQMPRIDAEFIDLSRDLTEHRSRHPTALQPLVRAANWSDGQPGSASMAGRNECRVACRPANCEGQTSRSFRRAALLYATGGVRQHLVDETSTRDCLPRLHAAPGQPRSRVPARPRQLLREHRARRASVPRRIGHRRNLGMGRARPGRAVSRLCAQR